ncbi:MAG: hypothetical protein AAGC71_18300, partial [Pseudomonadota bacterium]
MNKPIVVGGVVCAAVVIAVVLRPSDEPTAPPVAPPAEAPIAIESAASHPTPPPAPAPEAASSLPTAAELAESERQRALYNASVLMTEGFVITEVGDYLKSRVVHRNCRDEAYQARTSEGLVSGTTRVCDKVREYDHAYDLLDTAALGELAKTDGIAALMFAEKMQREWGMTDERLVPLYIHAFALSAEPQAFRSLRNVASQGAAIRYQDGVLNVDQLERSYIWSRVGELVNVEHADSQTYYAPYFEQAGIKSTERLETIALEIATRLHERHQSL